MPHPDLLTNFVSARAMCAMTAQVVTLVAWVALAVIVVTRMLAYVAALFILWCAFVVCCCVAVVDKFGDGLRYGQR